MCVVDMHNHIVTPAVVKLLRESGESYGARVVEDERGCFVAIGESSVRPLHDRMTDAAVRVQDMDRLGIDIQAVSCTPFLMFPNLDPALAQSMARINNESLAEISADHPGRFAPLASVPLQDPDLAVHELKHAKALGLRGAQIPPNTPELDLDDSRLEPFWATAAELQMPLCIHPFDAAPCGALSRHMLGPLVGNLFDTGLAGALLVMSGVLERHPDLRIVLYHAGGTFPALVARLDKGFELFPPVRKSISRAPSSFVSQLSFDTVAFEPAWLHHLVERFGASQLVTGSDYPLPLGPQDPAAEVRALGLTLDDERAVLGGNACRLLQLDQETGAPL